MNYPQKHVTYTPLCIEYTVMSNYFSKALKKVTKNNLGCFPCRDYDREQFAENQVPLLLIGTKFDQIPENKRSEVLTRISFLSEDFNAEEINLVRWLHKDFWIS